MSNCYFKYTIDLGYYESYHDVRTIYKCCEGCTDYQRYLDEDGDDIILGGSDEFIECLAHILNCESDEHVTREVLSYHELPDKIKEQWK